MEDNPYYLQEGEIELESNDGYIYEATETCEDGEQLSSDGEEDLDVVLRHTRISSPGPSIQLLTEGEGSPHDIVGVARGEVVEDFVRNFLVRYGLQHTVECFESEWYQLAAKNQLASHHKETVMDVYTQNKKLEEEVNELHKSVGAYKKAAESAKEHYVRLKKERDYHRMHHRRIMQEKDRLLNVIKSLRDQLSCYQPAVKELRGKYEAATREKMLATLEKNKAMAEVNTLQSTLHSLQPSTLPHISATATSQPQKTSSLPPVTTATASDSAKHNKPSAVGVFVSIPPEPANPYRHKKDLPICAQQTRVGGLQCVSKIKAHSYPISSIALHPTKNVLATAGDDHCWKLWTAPNGDHLMTGAGHSDWISSCQFHPNGNLLATTSGDGSAKLWSFTQNGCVLTLSDHWNPVWSCGWHWSGGLLATASMDHCCKLWDIESGQCFVTLRGHADSVNSVMWLPYSNTLTTCSADKTVSLWDARTGLCVQTFYGHNNSCNDVISNCQSSVLYSADCFGVVLCWELKAMKNFGSWDLGPLPVNKLAIDPVDSVLACGSGNGAVMMIDKESGKVTNLDSATGSVESLLYSHSADMLYTGTANGTVVVWQ